MAKDEYRDTTFAELKKAHPSVRVEALPNLSDAENRQRFLQALDFQRLLVRLILMLAVASGITLIILVMGTHLPSVANRLQVVLDQVWPNTDGSVADAYAKIYGLEKARRYAEVFTLATLITLTCAVVWLVLEFVLIARRDRHWLPRTDMGAPHTKAGGENICKAEQVHTSSGRLWLPGYGSPLLGPMFLSATKYLILRHMII